MQLRDDPKDDPRQHFRTAVTNLSPARRPWWCLASVTEPRAALHQSNHVASASSDQLHGARRPCEDLQRPGDS